MRSYERVLESVYRRECSKETHDTCIQLLKQMIFVIVIWIYVVIIQFTTHITEKYSTAMCCAACILSVDTRTDLQLPTSIKRRQNIVIEMFIFQQVALPSGANNADNNNNGPTTISVIRSQLSILQSIARALQRLQERVHLIACKNLSMFWPRFGRAYPVEALYPCSQLGGSVRAALCWPVSSPPQETGLAVARQGSGSNVFRQLFSSAAHPRLFSRLPASADRTGERGVACGLLSLSSAHQ